MLVCPAGHVSKDPDVCDVCDLPLHGGPRVPPDDDGLDVETAAARTRTLPGGLEAPPSAATTVMPTAPGSGGVPAAATTVLPSGPDGHGDASQAATTAMPAHPAGPSAADPSQAATTAMPTHPTGPSAESSQAATTAMPAHRAGPSAADPSQAATTVMPVTGPAAPSGSPAATEVFAAPPAPIHPATPAFRHPAPAARPDEGPAVPPTGATAVLGQGRNAHWHAVLTVDAAWYAVQDTPYQMPPEGRTTVVPLGSGGATLGRRSRSRGTVPDIDCSTDPGVSRRHARFELVHGRWYVEDLGSANGTYVAHAGAPLPEHPISVGRRVEVGPGDTVYVGAWTRISIEDDDAWGTS